MDKVMLIATYGDFFSSFQINNINRWLELGCEVHCVANFMEPKYNRNTEKLIDLGIEIHNIEFSRSPYSKKLLSNYKELKKLLKDEEITVIDTHNPIVSVISRVAAFKCHINKVIYTVHGFFFFKGSSIKNQILFKPIEFIMAKYTDILITTNLEDYKIAQKMKVRDKVHYVPGVGVDAQNIRDLNINPVSKRSEIGLPINALVFISVGECIDRKNHESAIRAFAEANLPNSYYVIIGDGELLEYLKSLTENLNITNKVIFTGFRKDANEFLKCSDIFLFPSYQEGLSVALLQAMAAGLPVLASRIRGNVDCIIEYKGGLLFSPHNVDDIRNQMVKIFNNSEERKRYGSFNMDYIKNFDIKLVSSLNKEIFTNIVNK